MKKKKATARTSKGRKKQTQSNKAKSVTSSRQSSLLYMQFIDQLRGLKTPLIIFVAFGISGILITLFLSRITGMPFSYLTRDMAAVCRVKETIGFLSNIGIILWTSTAAVCIFSASIMRRRNRRRKFISFFMFSGLFTLWLALDDLFLFHDRVFPDYLKIPEKLVHGIYASIIILYIASFLEEIMSTEYILLVMAGFFLATSMSLDVFFVFGESETFFEDSFKFFGITFWFGYFCRTASLILNKQFESG